MSLTCFQHNSVLHKLTPIFRYLANVPFVDEVVLAPFHSSFGLQDTVTQPSAGWLPQPRRVQRSRQEESSGRRPAKRTSFSQRQPFAWQQLLSMQPGHTDGAPFLGRREEQRIDRQS